MSKIPVDSTVLGERITVARRDAGITTQRELARHLGVTRSAVSEWEKNKSKPSTRNLIRIAQITKKDFDWLATGRASRSAEFNRAPVVGVVEAEVWREHFGGHAAVNIEESKFVPNLSHPDLRFQFAFEVRGCSANRTVRAGDYVICLDYREARPSGPSDGDLVVLEKYRGPEARRECKIMMGRLHPLDGTWEFHLESNEPRWLEEKPVRLSPDLNRDLVDNCEVRIVGHVLAALRFDPRPQFEATALAQLSRQAGHRRTLPTTDKLANLHPNTRV
jgi:transcriptional regulator with XRE-family HTH domain